eukprot:15296149-Alexandrium_andersonii.AAC.1
MSASLVGSEMCIRDRLDPPRRGWMVFLTRPTSARKPRCTSSRRRLRPVSYTHLTLPTICSV